MLNFYEGGVVPLSIWVVGVVILGAMLAYGVLRAGHLSRRDRAAVDENTVRRQISEDPQKRAN